MSKLPPPALPHGLPQHVMDAVDAQLRIVEVDGAERTSPPSRQRAPAYG